MKKLFMLLLIATSVNAKAQTVTIHTDSTGIYANITPVVFSIADEDTCARLSVRTFNDNQVNYASIYWELQNEKGFKVHAGNINVSGEQYLEWKNSNDESSYLYNFVATKMKSLFSFN